MNPPFRQAPFDFARGLGQGPERIRRAVDDCTETFRGIPIPSTGSKIEFRAGCIDVVLYFRFQSSKVILFLIKKYLTTSSYGLLH